MTEDGGQRFHIKAVSCTVSCKGVAQLVKIMIIDLSSLQYLPVAILHSSRLNRLISTRKNIEISFISEHSKILHKSIRNRNNHVTSVIHPVR